MRSAAARRSVLRPNSTALSANATFMRCNPRGRILLAPVTKQGLFRQLAAALATGNTAVIDKDAGLGDHLKDLPQSLSGRLVWASNWAAAGPFSGALVEGDAGRITEVSRRIADLPGPLVLIQAASSEAVASDADAYCLNWLLEEVSTSINTAAAAETPA